MIVIKVGDRALMLDSAQLPASEVFATIHDVAPDLEPRDALEQIKATALLMLVECDRLQGHWRRERDKNNG